METTISLPSPARLPKTCRYWPGYEDATPAVTVADSVDENEEAERIAENSPPSQTEAETTERTDNTILGAVRIPQSKAPDHFDSNAEIIACIRAEVRDSGDFKTRMKHFGSRLNIGLYQARCALFLVTSILEIIAKYGLNENQFLKAAITPPGTKDIEGLTLTYDQRIALDAVVQRFTSLSELMPISRFFELITHHRKDIWPVIYNMGRWQTYDLFGQRCINAHEYLNGVDHPEGFVGSIFYHMSVFPRLEVELRSLIEVMEDFIPDVEDVWEFNFIQPNQESRIGWVVEAYGQKMIPRNRTPPFSPSSTQTNSGGEGDADKYRDLEALLQLEPPQADADPEYDDTYKSSEDALWAAECEARQQVSEPPQVGWAMRLFATAMQASWARKQLGKLCRLLDQWYDEHPEWYCQYSEEPEEPEDLIEYSNQV
ncbi:uncharacterized protein BDZ99DRAFT_527844 [Mytilinidion resinicola]|uniref:Uncharacterized protein n=1 Tax=Mytilinidion resinicola TaxID=574789 RepID=A0A6A6Y0K6_9PEZI|nr:uncharacterized protein BDZ99DRAFT_527844 [Mytilinidion resinicola]KAF2802180.1 hypothetical protein BDZ99DRAFT_527844 [Mytilinidion resinicola]